MIQGIVGGDIPTFRYASGAGLGLLFALSGFGGIGVLVGLGFYMPFAIVLTYTIGNFLRVGADKVCGKSWVENTGIPLAAGLIVGEALVGVGKRHRRGHPGGRIMNITKLYGSLALFGGFLAGAYVVVAQAETIDWTHYAIAVAVMFVGLVASRAAAKDAAAGDDSHGASLKALQSSLERIIAKVREFGSIDSDEALTELHTRIDAELVEPIGDFVEARESMIPLFGMQTYADIMSAFATGERLINRTWSASADGYVDEVRSCLGTALTEFESADKQLAAAST